jgi:Fe2+ or Zn2+ uptake regulation protein
MKTLKYSRQRESIKANLMSRHDHPTADALYASIREEFPNISLGTVYRNLNLLVETARTITTETWRHITTLYAETADRSMIWNWTKWLI